MARGVKDERRSARQLWIISRVLRRSRRKGWDDEKTAAVIHISLLPSRVKYGVVGPCFYCGDDLASSVDHMAPLSKGGSDDAENAVSSCWPCNDLKGTSPLEWFLWVHPYGSDRAREIAYVEDMERLGLTRCRGPVIAGFNDAASGAWQLPRMVDDAESEPWS